MPENCPSGKMNLEQRLHDVAQRVWAAEIKVGREPGSVQILPVSKTRPAEDIAAVADLAIAGMGRAFGENYLQEAVDKIAALAKRNLQWHFIGPIPSNKTALIAQHFDWVHSVDGMNIAQRLNAERPVELPALDIFLQVNVCAEASTIRHHAGRAYCLGRASRAIATIAAAGIDGHSCGEHGSSGAACGLSPST